MTEYTEVSMKWLSAYPKRYVEIIDWLYVNVGYGSESKILNDKYNWNKFTRYDKGPHIVFWFKNKDDAMLFKLTWIGI